MTKAQLIAPGSPPALKLRALAKEINELTTAIDISVERVKEGISIALTNAILTGQALIKAKAEIPHGQWLDWLAAHCPRITRKTAAQYMNLADRADEIKSATSIRQALFLLSDKGDEPSTGEKRNAQQWPAYLEGVRRISKWTGFVSKHPLSEWPEEGKAELRGKLEPIVRELFPERFGNAADSQTVDVQSVALKLDPLT